MKLAYLVNQYPKVSHSFIRREILALEALGVSVERFAVRGWRDAVSDPADEVERTRTTYLLEPGPVALLGALLITAVGAPGRFLGALREAWRLSRRAERPFAVHLIYLAEAALLARALKARGVTHLHAHFGTNSATVALLSHGLGGPGYSFTVHGPEEFDKPQAIALGRKIDRARFVVGVSAFGRSQLYRWTDPACWDKVKVVHCGLEQAFHADPVAAGSPGAADQRFVCVGRLCEQKGQMLLVRALAALKAQGVTPQLVLAGDGEMRAQIEALARELGVQSQIRITGWISSATVREELMAARALVLPSFAEGLPVVIMEAMALARPVISTYVAGIPELVRDGQTGWLIPAGDVDALVEAMHSCLLQPPAVLSSMGAAGRQRVLARHDVDTEAARLLAFIQEHSTAPEASAARIP